MQRKQILILSVGGSPAPLINTIQTCEPQKIVFVCSETSALAVDGEGHPTANPRYAICPDCSKRFATGPEKGHSLARRLGLSSEDYLKWIVPTDNLDEIMDRLSELEALLDREHPGADVAINYTGGTKTMSAALVLLALGRTDWRLDLNTGPRTDLLAVHGHDIVQQASVESTRTAIQLDSVRTHLGAHSYGAAARTLRGILRGTTTGPKSARRQKILAAIGAFDAWDRFDHRQAMEIIQSADLCSDAAIHPFFQRLKILTGHKKAHGFELVADLLDNAGRREMEERYDDAVGRLYRALELTAQTMLKKRHDLDTSHLGLERLPEEFARTLPNVAPGKKSQIGLMKAWKLLALLEPDFNQNVWEQHHKSVLNTLCIRNYSILAHGLKPISREDWGKVQAVFPKVITETTKHYGITLTKIQLPGEEILGWFRAP